MDKYDDEMYKYLTTPENYKAAKEVAELLNKVNKRLEEEFWDEVGKQFVEKIEKEIKYQDYSASEPLSVKRSNWDGVKISSDMYDYGICIDTNKIEKEKVVPFLSQKNSEHHLGDNGSEPWPCYFENYLSFGEFINILPENRETKISELVNLIFKYIEAATDVCDEINKMKKEKSITIQTQI
jgi:hypothetical protein